MDRRRHPVQRFGTLERGAPVEGPRPLEEVPHGRVHHAGRVRNARVDVGRVLEVGSDAGVPVGHQGDHLRAVVVARVVEAEGREEALAEGDGEGLARDVLDDHAQEVVVGVAVAEPAPRLEVEGETGEHRQEGVGRVRSALHCVEPREA